MLNFAGGTDEQLRLTIKPVTGGGKPATIEPNSLKGTVQSGEGAVEVVNASELIFRPVDDVAGDTIILIEGDADVGEGVETISELVTYTASSPRAKLLGVSGVVEAKS